MPASLLSSLNSHSAPASPAAPATHTNFIVLGHARCGSNLLVRALAEHPQTRMLSEVLSPHASAREAGWNNVNRLAWTEPRGEGYHVGEDGAEFLDTKVFGHDRARNIRTYGFKLFYDHARFDESSATAWDYILSHEDIKVVHLIRHNLLHALISREIAIRTQNWHRLIEDSTPIPPPMPAFPLDPQACLKYFDQITGWRKWAGETFARHQVLTIHYETELCSDFETTASRVFEFLGSIQWYSRPGMVKQQAIPASQQLSNFEELRKFFSGGPYAEFFENDVLFVAT